YGYALPDSWRETVEREQARSRQMAATTQQKLTTGAADGSLTDEEIREAVGGPGWEMQRTDPVWLLRARFDGTEPICFSFEITTPLGPATRVTATELPTCPPDLP
ncbi:MAG TPA: hypothetical protein VN408_04970, partial [Actinoplanes sp.]|nr:hypothetical protein [Actinoplanes sp.]